jgi:hypothetical protein
MICFNWTKKQKEIFIEIDLVKLHIEIKTKNLFVKNISK